MSQSEQQEKSNGIYDLIKLKQAYNNGQHFNFVYFNDFREDDINLDLLDVGCFSQNFPIQFSDDDGRTYSCSVQYVMSHKALLFDDQEAFNKIMNSTSPLEMVELARKLKNFDQRMWNQNSENIVYQGNLYKFTQNDPLKSFILSFPSDTIFVNSDPENNYWGIKLSENDQKALNPNKWQGFNKLGFQLTKIRDDILKTNPQITPFITPPISTTEGVYSLEILRQLWIEGKRFHFVYFWQISEVNYDFLNESCFCQWFPSDFTDDDGIQYNCCEQYMMAKKAVLFNDKQTLNKILSNSDPQYIKKLGREVKNFDLKIWGKNNQQIVYNANLLKFGQNEKLKNYMLSFSRNTIFVEASPLDAIWGIKLSADDKRAKNPLNWKGTNFLGFQLTRVRDTFLKS